MAFAIFKIAYCLLLFLPRVISIPSPGNHVPSLSRPPRSFFSLVRDSIIQTIWDVPEKHNTLHAATSQQIHEQAPSNLRAQYGGDVVLRFSVTTSEELKALAEASEILYLDVWESTDEWVDIRLAKDMVPSLLGLLPASLHNAHTPLMHDLAQAIFESYPAGPLLHENARAATPHQGFTPSLRREEDEPGEGRELFFQDYQPMSVIYPWMRLMASLFPTHTRMINIGYSYEGRDIPALRVGVHPKNNEQPSEPRKTIIISGGTHAREWISVSTVNYVAYQMITHYGKWPGLTKLIEEFDWVFIPTINPDGYVYTWDNDRLWRKNRQQTDLRFCKGVDIDRAWSFQWDGELTRSNPCSESYAGTVPFEGVEAKRFAEWAKNETENNNVDLVAYLDLHSYSQQILYPYSYSCYSTPPTLENLQELAMGLAKAIRLTDNHVYGVSSACEGSINAATKTGKEVHAKMELGGGSALDWFYHEMQVKYAYQIKLRDTGSYGFLLPKSNIVPTGQEVFNAVAGLGRFLTGNKGIENDSFENEMLGSKAGSSRSREQVSNPGPETHESQQSSDIEDGSESIGGRTFSQDLRRRRKR